MSQRTKDIETTLQTVEKVLKDASLRPHHITTRAEARELALRWKGLPFVFDPHMGFFGKTYVMTTIKGIRFEKDLGYVAALACGARDTISFPLAEVLLHLGNMAHRANMGAATGGLMITSYGPRLAETVPKKYKRMPETTEKSEAAFREFWEGRRIVFVQGTPCWVDAIRFYGQRYTSRASVVVLSRLLDGAEYGMYVEDFLEEIQ